jgi:hypothetical protein
MLVTENLQLRFRPCRAQQLIAGSVSTKSPIAPPRITRIRFNSA